MGPINHVGERFGRLTVLRIADERKYGQLCFVCRCDCGTEKTMTGSDLRTGRTRSCGCLRREKGIERGKASRRHGEASKGKETPEYRAWANMISRCHNSNHIQFANYGGRGIVVCDRWRSSYESFLSDMGRRPDRFHTLDRIDNDGVYRPQNCRWTTWQQQNNNQRKRREWRMVTINGETKPLAEWLRQYGVTRSAYDRRRTRGAIIEESITRPLQVKSPKPS